MVLKSHETSWRDKGNISTDLFVYFQMQIRCDVNAVKKAVPVSQETSIVHSSNARFGNLRSRETMLLEKFVAWSLKAQSKNKTKLDISTSTPTLHKKVLLDTLSCDAGKGQRT